MTPTREPARRLVSLWTTYLDALDLWQASPRARGLRALLDQRWEAYREVVMEVQRNDWPSWCEFDQWAAERQRTVAATKEA